MRHHVREMSVCLLVGMVCLLVPGQASARDGWYMGMDLGVAIAPGLDVAGKDNDSSSTCDKFITGVDASGSNGVGGGSGFTEAADCDDPVPPAEWVNEFGGGGGILAGLALGYRFGNFRVEGEYFYRGSTYDEADKILPSDQVTLDKLDNEIDLAEGAIDDLLSHNFFANLYYDFVSDSKFTPYLGFGVGAAHVSLDYLNVWRRNVDISQITTFGLPGACNGCDEANEALAGTTSIGRAKHSDVLFGYQAIAGVDYQVSEPVTIGLKLRWADFSEFVDGEEEYDQLRSHDSTNSPYASDRRSARVRYQVTTDDIKFFGVSINMKYRF